MVIKLDVRKVFIWLTTMLMCELFTVADLLVLTYCTDVYSVTSD